MLYYYVDVCMNIVVWRQTIYLYTVVDESCCFRISDGLKFELVLYCYMYMHVHCTCMYMYICMYMYNIHHVHIYMYIYV